MKWDIFCRVIDNHGDLGVCWRLARQLAAKGESVRLWVDDAQALAWMAPGGTGAVQLVRWGDAQAEAQALARPAPEVLIEAFGCDPAPALVAHFAQAAQAEGAAPHAWINLEYLSAEPVVERLHGLPSLVFSGPGAGLKKHFFYPGFTPGTGGLLREADLAQRQARFDRAAWLARHGIAPGPQERLFSLFCYEPPALGALLAQLAQGPQPTRLLVTPGRAAAAVRQVLAAQTPGGPAAGPHEQAWGWLTLQFLPALPQAGYDELLWACDLNFVRGEDSFVRAHWAAAPLVWHIYPQDEDDAHHAKLQAWLDWLQAPNSLRAFHRAWNGVGQADAALRAVDALADPATLGAWRSCLDAARARLLAQPDLLTQLQAFVKQKS
ncbi:elongation factor P maturation arginine rhamnosyltransferase EarP [Xenophilus arseniciresistens]|uniref:Protein-arginine rhamnosyltransferase n=1 Tax=Xenophilus arseniciresistens TaxID=1283306 RepID=A0AAE3N7C7_9BURK|nr:elongation factor P maturation arginine rhamnosyltransferase EarP [Xenophilus arseniciresistens]MDA7416238.1 elongation factor P maturation arginine rhamnosyltransferase EarP [Xenophilus arseniciresistens]